MHVIDMHVSMLCIFILLCITVVGLSLMMEQSQHLLHLLWLLCWWVLLKVKIPDLYNYILDKLCVPCHYSKSIMSTENKEQI